MAGYESGYFGGYINQSCFAVSSEGRIFVFDNSLNAVVYSDDSGDTWQQMPQVSSCAMANVKDLYATSNETVIGWATNGEIFWTTDGGATWGYAILSFLENSESVSDLLVNENGDVYVSVSYYIMSIVGILHTTLSDMENWELVAFEGVSIKDMAFDPEGNVVACGYNDDGSSIGFQYTPGFYLFDGTTMAISDDGIVYTPHFMGLQAVLSYSTDHGEHFTEIGEHLPLVDIAPGGDAFFLIKGYDNHLYFDGGGEYWKTVLNANDLPNSNPWIGEKFFDEVSGLYYIITSDTTAEVTYNEIYNNSYSGDVVIPETVHYGGVAYTVNAVGKMAFANSSPMTSVVVPNTVKFIGESAFDQSKNLRTVILPRSVDSIGSMVFNDCTALINVSFPDNLTYLPDYLFNGCWNLTSFEMSPNIISIGKGSFRGTGLTTIAIPESVRTIGEDAFAYCSNITSMNVPNSVTSIGTGAFQMCTNLVSIQLPDHLEVISDYLLDCCQNLSSIVIPPTVTEIGFGAFTANGISDIEIPSTVTSIGTHAFSSCGNLTSVTLPESMEYLGENVFYNCGRLRRVTLPQNLAFIPKHLFEDCHQLDSIVLPESITSIGGWAFFNCNSLEEIRIPNHVDTIGTAAFLYCTNLRQVELGHSVSCIAEQAFLTQSESFMQQIDTTKKLTVISHNTTPPQCGYTTFPDAILQEKAIVPCGCEDIYREAWGEYWTGGFEEDCGTSGNEWYYEILNDDGSITYQYLQQAGDTLVNNEEPHIIIRINTLYDKGEHVVTSHEYIFDRDDKVYWWNKDLQEFTVLYDYSAEPGDEWEIKVGTETLVMHVDAVDEYEYEGRMFKMLQVSDENNVFSGTIVCGIGHLTSFFPERLMNSSKGYRVEGIRCFWKDEQLLFKYGEKDCDEVYEEFHDYGLDEPTGDSGLQIYPNPCDGILTISGAQPGEYRITNLLGQNLTTSRIDTENQQINVAALPTGVYFINIDGKTTKFVKY